jgi:hypothetical protein
MSHCNPASTVSINLSNVAGAPFSPNGISKKFILDTDASNEAIGAVLSQEIDGKERPIAFASPFLQKR